MSALPEHLINCPYCNETNEILIEFNEDSETQDYIEDCQVCCQPIHIIVETDSRGEIQVLAKTDDEV
ncbi:CPXCG motif-containing cysteine-rich protein [Bermanella sp. WJH001]|uniref:CPXCG motif-containing cysteine-rich protein n=1 Tax=Bermanella sp. WJH001 TaxID=3048005 RepID=UPI0024BEEC65|nr:CPXCG motif-containing cysteine-rich protein [Bermanella sp. WJH001]MDJ1537810.1 CPXCG motif-containing cysteine-rich protein [Bermanella sp. WJH001]